MIWFEGCCFWYHDRQWFLRVACDSCEGAGCGTCLEAGYEWLPVTKVPQEVLDAFKGVKHG